MTLLDATGHLIEIAKTFGRDDAITRRAIKRMEKRLALLQLRKAKALRARRHKAWWNGPSTQQCPHPECEHEITFGEFCRTAEIDGRGRTKRWNCPHCGRPIVIPPEDLAVPAIDELEAQRWTDGCWLPGR